MGAVRPIPTAPASGPGAKALSMLDGVFHRAQTARRDPEREADHQAFTVWFQAWLDKNHISLRDLADLLRVEFSTARKKRSGESPLSFVDVRRFPKRHRHELTFAFLVFCDEADLSNSHR